MSEKTVVVALGHKALGATLPEQKQATKAAQSHCRSCRGWCTRCHLPQQRTSGRHDPYSYERIR